MFLACITITILHKIEIDCGKGEKMRLMSFTKMIDQKTDRIVFAYKFKNQDMVIIYYLPDKLTKENRQKIKKFMAKMQAITEMIGYEMVDAKKFAMTVAGETKRLKKKFTQNYSTTS